MDVILIAIVLMALAFAGIAIRLLLIKNGEFKGTCSSNNPLLKNELGECTLCGSKPGEECKSEETRN
jgi:hypothetical protein